MDLGEHREAWDVICLSLVLNFVPDAKDRGTPPSSITVTHDRIFQLNFLFFFTLIGRMLVQAHSMIRSGGLCFIAVRLDESSALALLSAGAIFFLLTADSVTASSSLRQ